MGDSRQSLHDQPTFSFLSRSRARAPTLGFPIFHGIIDSFESANAGEF